MRVERRYPWNPVMALDEGATIPRIVNPNEIGVLSSDGYEDRAVDLFNRGYHELSLVAAILSIGARMDEAV